MERPIFRLTASSTELAAADRFDVINWIRSFEWRVHFVSVPKSLCDRSVLAIFQREKLSIFSVSILFSQFVPSLFAAIPKQMATIACCHRIAIVDGSHTFRHDCETCTLFARRVPIVAVCLCVVKFGLD